MKKVEYKYHKKQCTYIFLAIDWSVQGVSRLHPEEAGIGSSNPHDPTQDEAVIEDLL